MSTVQDQGLSKHTGARNAGLALGSIGVVYGDIGTSPLYALHALREAITFAARDGLTEPEILGVVSLIVWALTIVVTCKYVILMLRLDNQGEGGILSLLALVQGAAGRRMGLLFLGIAGAALFYGDAIITPAISVLSAVEGLSLIRPELGHWVLPLTSIILLGVFWLQSRGTSAVAMWFGPIMFLWFVVLAGLGQYWIGQAPQVLWALLPTYAIRFLIEHAAIATAVVGLIFLAVTGAEALYLDLGHFGKTPIRMAWCWVVFPALSLNYLGQCGLILSNPDSHTNPMFLMLPDWGAGPVCPAGNCGNGHRQPGRYKRGVFHHPSGGSAWSSAKAEYTAHIKSA